MKTRIIIVGTFLMLLLMAVPDTAFANSSGRTGSTDGCGAGSCHSSTTPTVTPSLSGTPSSGYAAGTTYSLSISASGGPSGTTGGFNLDSSQGVFSNPGPNAQISLGEVTHTNSNSRAWSVDWTAPPTGSGDVVFYLAVNLVNGNGGTSGDSWGADSWTLSEVSSSPTPTPVNNLGFNQPGSDRGSVFSHSVLDLDTGSPILVLSNGSLVTFNGTGASVVTNDEVISSAGDCTILYNRTLRCSGANNYGQLGIGSNSLSNGTVDFGTRTPVAISNGNYHNCAILDDASLNCWGRNNHGQIGDSSNVNRNSPVAVDLGVNRTAISVSAGNDFTCAILDTGEIKCWGFNGFGNLGDGTTTSRNSPVLANHSTGLRASSLVTPGFSVCAIFDNGSISCWGKTYTVSAQNGPVTGSSSDIQLPNGRTASDIDGTSWHTCALLDNGSISCWGVNTHGQRGDGTCSSSSSSCSGTDGNVPSYALMPSPAIALATGIESTCAINQSYSLFCWGSQSGEFDGSANDILMPYLMDFNNSTLGESVAYSEQDLDGDGIRNVLDLAISDDSDGDGFNSSIDDFPDNPARWVSCPDGQWGRLSCQNSSSGHFSLQGSLFHVSCTIGNYQPEEGRTICYDASSGYFVDEGASPDQQHCAPGFYQNDLAQSSCTPSPVGNYTNNQYGDADDVSPTPLQSRSATYGGQIGNYSWSNDSGDLFSIFVPRDTTVSVSLTNSTPNGDFSVSLYYYDSSMTMSLISTSDNSTQGGNVASVSTIGTSFTNASTLLMSVTPNNSSSGYYSFTLTLKSTIDDSIVGNQTESIDAEIQVGFFQCQPGTYQGKTGSGSCDNASPGRYVPSVGATSEDMCAPGSYQPLSGQISCIQASQGYFVSQNGSSFQTPSSPGNYVPQPGATSQTQCSPGNYQSSFAQAACIVASAGNYVVTSGSSNQTACSPGTYQPSNGSTSCIDASSGHHVPNYSSTSQIPCNPGYYQPLSAQQSCLSSSPGHYVPGIASISQIACDPGFYQPSSNQTLCLQATPGNYVPSNASLSQTPCQPGTFQSSYMATECIDAYPGYYVEQPGSTTQTPCAAGTYNPSDAANSSQSCLDADPGHAVPSNGSSYQTPCTSGFYQSMSGQTSCIPAPPGYYIDSDGATSPSPCLPGYWANQAGLSECLEASPGFYTDSNASSTQIPCPSGSYNPVSGANSSTACLETDPGNYSAILGASYQTPCSPGEYQPNTGQESCLQADPGHFVELSGEDSQEECQVGEYQPSPGQQNCINADSGFYVDSEMSTSQNPCPAGTYNPDESSTSQSACLDSEEGYYVASPGSSEQTPCMPGSYQNQTRQISCMPTEPGYYALSEGSNDQNPCVPGTYQPTPGQSACLDASPGFFTSSGASVSQEECLPGTFQPSSGQSTCIDADIGFFVSEQGQAQQTPAPLDEFVSSTRSIATENCPEDTITLQESSTSADDCLLDSDGDRLHDEVDLDDDGDGINDIFDTCPIGLVGWTSTVDIDNDLDGCKDSEEDDDDDNDGFPDLQDALPLDATEWNDNDMDGIGDNSDTDDDNDGSSDMEEDARNTSATDPDSDDDGFMDGVDDFPLDPFEWEDSDLDGVGDNGDAFPNDPDRQVAEESTTMLIFAALVSVVVIGALGGLLFMRRRGENDQSLFSQSDDSGMVRNESTIYSNVSVPNSTSPLPEERRIEPIKPPSDAKMNENGQLVWVDNTGNVYCQNPDGSILSFNQSTGSWGPVN